MKDENMHLNEEQILISLVDEKDLAKDNQSHLQSCLACREKKTALMSELDRLGKMTKEFTPLPRQKARVYLPESRRRRFLRPVFAAGFAVAFIIVCLLSLKMFIDSPKEMTARLSPESGADLYLIDDLLEESILPEYFLDIAVASYSYFDDEFIKFVVPLEESFNSVTQTLPLEAKGREPVLT